MPPRPVENVWSYPRPPILRRTSARLRVIWRGANQQEVVLADTTRGYRVLETSHPPTYYFPMDDVKISMIKESAARRTVCEYKGTALYHDLVINGLPLSRGRIWSYPNPRPPFKAITDYFCFYATSKSDPNTQGSWQCYVDDDAVRPQEGDFYGSWITPEITGGEKGFKGGVGTFGW